MSLRIGQYIKFALGHENAPELDRMLSGKLSPVRLPDNADTEIPWICYRSDSLDEQDTKDGPLCDTNTVVLDVVCRTYEELLDTLCAVRKAMQKAVSVWNARNYIPFRVEEQTFNAGAEEYDEILQAYCRPLIFIIKTEEIL